MALDQIIRHAAARNAALGVTGALLFTGDRFAQWLEGEEDAVRSILASIVKDDRHRDVTILQQGPAERRRFRQWSLAYAGVSTFAGSTVQNALEAGRDEYPVRNLIRLMEELARQPRPGQSEA